MTHNGHPTDKARREICGLLESMAQTLESQNYDAVTRAVDEPVMIADRRHMVVYDSPAQFLPLIPQLYEAYRQMGVARSEIASIRFIASSEAFQIVDVCWRQIDAQGAPLFEFDITYAFRLRPDGWRIAFIANHNEHERWPSAAGTETQPAPQTRDARRESAA